MIYLAGSERPAGKEQRFIRFRLGSVFLSGSSTRKGETGLAAAQRGGPMTQTS